MSIGHMIVWLFFTISSSHAFPGVYQRCHDPVNFVDNTCDQAQKDMIHKAFADARQMAKVASDPTIDFQNDAAFLDLFGPRAITNLSSILAAYSVIFSGNWSITARCDPNDTDIKCKDPYTYGGLGSVPTDPNAKSFAPTIIFCNDFFQLGPLDSVIGIRANRINVGDVQSRFRLDHYYLNQGDRYPHSLLQVC